MQKVLENTHSNLNTTLNKDLKEMTLKYLESHPSLTLNALAQRSGVAGTTLRRLVQENRSSELAPHVVLNLVSYLLKEKRISVLLTKVTGAIHNFLNESFKQFIFDQKVSNHVLLSDLNTELQDKCNYLIYKLASNHCGVALSEIKDQFGRMGVEKLEMLIKKEIIYLDANGFYHSREKNFSLDLEVAKTQTHALLDYYQPSKVDQGLNLFYSLSESLTEEAIKKIKDVEREAVKKIHQIMNDKESLGLIPYFSLSMSEVMGYDSLESNKQNLKEVLQ